MSNNLAAVARHQQLNADVLAAKTPAEQLQAERALRASLQDGDESGNYTVPRRDAPIMRPRFVQAAGDYK